MAIVVSTKDVPPHERLSFWREIATANALDLSASPGFLATLSNQPLDNVTVVELDCDPCRISRTPQNIARYGADHFFLCMQVNGRGVASQHDRVAVNQNRGFVLLDTDRPYQLTFEKSARTVSMIVPRSGFRERLGAAADALFGLSVSAGRPLGGIASLFLSMLPSRVEAADSVAASGLAEQALDLVTLALSVEVGQSPTLFCERAVSLYRLKAAIEARLSDQLLDPAAAAAVAGISVPYANDLLSREGFSFERYILHRRLERCRRALADPEQDHLPIEKIALAWGLASVFEFNRSFRAAYGLMPADYRRQAQETIKKSGAEKEPRKM